MSQYCGGCQIVCCGTIERAQPAIEALQFLAQACIATTPALPILYSLDAIGSTLGIDSLFQLMETQPNGFLCDTIGYLFSLQPEDLRSYDRVTDVFVQFIQYSSSPSNREAGIILLDWLWDDETL